MAFDRGLKVASKPSYHFNDGSGSRPTVKLPGRAQTIMDTQQDRPSVSIKAEGKKKKKPKWTKEMKQARDAAAARAANQVAIPKERNGLEASPLNNLPGELRNRIYELVLRVPRPVNINKSFECGKGGWKHRKNDKWKARHNFLALLFTCHQIRRESTAAFYSCNEFVSFVRFGWHGHNMNQRQASELDMGLRPARTWLKHIGQFNRAHLKSLIIDISVWETSNLSTTAKDQRGWWTGTLRAIWKHLLSIGDIEAGSVFVGVVTGQMLPHATVVDLHNRNRSPLERLVLVRCPFMPFKIPTARDREAARRVVETAYQKRLEILNSQVAHAATGSSLTDFKIVQREPAFLAGLKKARDRMLYAVGGDDGND